MQVRTAAAFAASFLLALAAVPAYALTFSDVPANAWFAPYVEEAASAGIVSGYTDAQGRLTGRFGPADNVTVGQALKMAVLAAGYDTKAFVSWQVTSDVGDHWALPYVRVMEAEDFVFRYLIEGKVRASLDRPAKRGEVVAIFGDAFASREDAGDSSAANLIADGIVSGDKDASGNPTGNLRLSDPINRAEVAKIIASSRKEYGTPGHGRGSYAGEDGHEDHGFGNDHVVTYTDDGFQPEVLRIKAGETVVFHNHSSHTMSVASDPHPAHTDLSGFDQKSANPESDTYEYTFTKSGNWAYHNHQRSSDFGLVIVE